MEKIKELRKKTGAGIVDCKKALEEAGGNIDKAIEVLRKKGITKAAKRSDREAGEGIIHVNVNEQGNEGYILEVNSETDFVARNEKFIELAKNVLELIMNNKPGNLDELMELGMINKLPPNTSAGSTHSFSVRETLDNLSGTIGEKLVINRFEIVAGPTVASYSHMDGEIGVLVVLDKENESKLAKDIAMQIAATNPKYIVPDEVPEEEKDKEKEIYKVQLLKENKPEDIIDKIIKGKISKYFEDVCLIKQEYIKEDKKRIEDILGDIKVERFVRYSL